MVEINFTKETSPWLQAQQTKKSMCTWCEGSIKEIYNEYWECVACGKYYEMY
jgi:hypothetical protein